MLFDDTCDIECANIVCGYDWGDCGWCSYECYREHLGNGICDEQCNNVRCKYDWGDCQSYTYDDP